MKYFVLAAVAILSLTAKPALASKHHTPNICSAQNSSLCLHLGFEALPQEGVESGFMTHFMLKDADPTLLSDVVIDLWMDMGNGHGHGSAPVTVEQLDAVHFRVTRAYFVMSGEWLVRVKFKYDRVEHEIAVPVTVQ